MWRNVGRSAGVRIMVLPVSAILGIVNTRIIIVHFGQEAYAQYGLLVGIGALLPFADLGMSAAVMNAVAGSEDPRDDPHVRQVLTTAIRILLGSTVVLTLVSVALTLGNAWEGLLGEGLMPEHGPLAAALCLCAVGISMPAGLGQRILTGLGKNHLSIALLGLQTPVVLLVLLLLVQLDANDGSFLAVIPYLVTFLLSLVCTWWASRQMGSTVRDAFRDVPHVRSVPGGHVFDTAWPMLLQMIALPIAMQTDRIVLSHVSDLENLSQYNLASQMYTPVWQVVSAAGVTLWPVFARARSGHHDAPRPQPIALAFAAAAAGVCLLISVLSPWLAQVASGGEITLPPLLLVSFSVFMVFQAAKYPLGMFMTDARGLRYQAYMILTLLPVNVGLSWWLGAMIGAAGPVIGSAVGVLLCQVIANWVYVRRAQRHTVSSVAP